MNVRTISAWAAPVTALVVIGASLIYGLNSQTPFGSISGTVTLDDSGKPIADAHIYLNPGSTEETMDGPDHGDVEGEPIETRSRRIATTDAHGHFSISRVPTGAYHLTADASYHNCPALDVTVDEAHTTELQVGLRRSEEALTLSSHQSVWSLLEKPHVPIRGYIDPAKGELDVVHMKVYKTRLSTLLATKETADSLQDAGSGGNHMDLPHRLLHPDNVPTDKQPKLVSSSDIPIQRPDREGFYTQRLVVPTTGPGLYLVQVEHGTDATSTWVLCTNTALVLKSAGPQLIAYAVDIVAGTPVGGANVRQYSDGALVARATTGVNGLAELTVPQLPRKKKTDEVDEESPDDTRKNQRMITIAERGEDEAVLKRDDWNGSDSGDEYTVYAYTDRTVYRPGQAVSYKGIVRRRTAAQAAVQTYTVHANAAVLVEVRDANGDRLLRETKTTNRWGTFDGSFDLAAEAPTGSYSLITTVDGEKHTSDIEVASYRKPEYAVTITPKKNHYVKGETIEMTVSAKYYYGAPVAGASVSYNVYRDTDWDLVYDGDSDPDDRDADEQNSYYGEMLTRGTVTLDGNGQATVSIPPDAKRSRRGEKSEDAADDAADADPTASARAAEKPEQQIVTCDATVTDDAKREVEAHGQAHLSAADFILSLTPEGYLGRPGAPTSLVVGARDYDGKPVADLPVTLTATYIKYDAKEKRSDTAQAGPKQTVKTGSGGSAVLNITPPEAGALNLVLTAYDTGGRVLHAHADLYACDDDGGDLATEYSDLSLLTDKKQYGPGDSARILINTARTGQSVLLTVEGERVYHSLVVPISKHSTVVNVPIDPAWGPNVTLDAVYVRDKKFADSNIPLRVRLDARTVKVSVDADRAKYRPGDSATYRIHTTNAATGKPVPCEVSLSVVDESIYALRADDPYALRDAFYPHRENEVRTFYSFAVEYEGDTDKSEPTIEMRRKFLDTAYWGPHLATDAGGFAAVTVPLPDNLTTWRATVQAVTMDTMVGRVTGTVLVTKPFFLRMDTPRFMTQSDDGRLLTLLHNDTGMPQTVHVKLTAPRLVKAGTAAEQTLQVAPGMDGQVEWPLSAQMIGIAQIRAEAWTDGRDPATGKQYTDGIETTLPIRAWGRQQITEISGVLEQGGVEERPIPIDVDTYAIPTESKLNVRILPNVGASIGPALDYLVGYPYGCVEQTTSRMLADLLVEQVQRATGHSLLHGPLAAKRTAALPKMVRNAILRLRNMQHTSGAWGWWELDVDSPGMTAYALYGLALARQQGYEVPQTTIDNGIKGALAQLSKADWDDRGFLLYALANAGETKELRELIAGINSGRNGKNRVKLAKLPPDSLAYLVLAARKIGADYLPAWNELQRREVAEGRLLYWKNPKDRWGSSDLMDTAAGLRAVLTVNPRDTRIPNILRYMLLKRGDGYWGNTRDTAMVLGGIADYLTLHPEDSAPPTGSITVAVDGREVQHIDLAANADEQEILVPVPLTFLPRGAHTLTLHGAGVGGTVFYSGALQQTVTTREGDLPAIPGADVSVSREYLRLGTKQSGKGGVWSLVAEDVAGNSFKQDDHLHVRLTVTTKRDIDYVLIEDAFPSNCEPTERGTAEEETAGTNSEAAYWYDNIDVRDDRIAFFATHLSAGTHTLEYNLRAQTPAVCHALPVQMQAMYAPEIRAESSDTRVEVNK